MKRILLASTFLAGFAAMSAPAIAADSFIDIIGGSSGISVSVTQVAEPTVTSDVDVTGSSSSTITVQQIGVAPGTTLDSLVDLDTADNVTVDVEQNGPGAGSTAESDVFVSNSDGSQITVDQLTTSAAGGPVSFIDVSNDAVGGVGNTTITVIQRNGAENADSNVVANGDGNIVTVTQDASETPVADVDILGDGNNVVIDQLSSDASGGDLRAVANLTGDGNLVDILQDNAVDATAEVTVVGSTNNPLMVTQQGQENDATIDIINGSGNQVDIFQDGDSVTADVDIDDSAGNVIDIDQGQATGAGVAVDVFVNIDNGSDNNTITALQTGDNNAATFTLDDSSNNNADLSTGVVGLVAEQFGANNVSIMTLTAQADGNNVYHNQLGDGNGATTVITSSTGSIVTVTQN